MSFPRTEKRVREGREKGLLVLTFKTSRRLSEEPNDRDRVCALRTVKYVRSVVHFCAASRPLLDFLSLVGSCIQVPNCKRGGCSLGRGGCFGPWYLGELKEAGRIGEAPMHFVH